MRKPIREENKKEIGTLKIRKCYLCGRKRPDAYMPPCKFLQDRVDKCLEGGKKYG